MFDDDIRYSRGEDRPPWELSPGGQLREFFSCRKVDDVTAAYCHEVEEHKRARIRAEEKRKQTQAAAQARRAAAQRQMRREQGRTEPPPPPKDHDPRGDRYIYPEQPSGGLGRKKQSGKLTGVVLIVVVALCAVGVIGGLREGLLSGISGSDAAWSFEEVTPPDDEGIWRDDWDDAWEDGWGDDSFELPEPDSGQETSNAPAEIDRAELDGALSVEIHSAAGREPLSYQELYQTCYPCTVSITVYSEDGIGTGTGIVMTEDGYILTCNHVVEGGASCEITTYDDQVYQALLVGGDAQTDLAVLKIDAEGLRPAEFGDSDELTVGDEALAIGDPLGTELRGTLTNGIISAINRNVTVNSYSMTLLQTTAALNSGNSGGPLINIYGQVVGVNNMKMNSNAVTVEGLGFAVPTSVVKEIVPILSTEGKVSRPVLGITCYGIDAQTAERNHEATTGLRVASINDASDAKDQGLQIGDYIHAINGVEVVSVEEVKVILQDLQIGDTIELLVYRVNEDDPDQLEELTITVTLVDQADLS